MVSAVPTAILAGVAVPGQRLAVVDKGAAKAQAAKGWGAEEAEEARAG